MLRYMYVDMNSYFASVEQQEQADLRGRPVGVVPILANTTCCIAASYEAKAFGVKTGTQVALAKHLCPDIALVQARPKLYVQYHHRIIDAVESCLHVDAVSSIDEMYGRLMGCERQVGPAIRLAERVKQAIRTQVGPYVRCSVGLGPNVWLAKVATDMEKPDGLTAIRPDDLPDTLFALELDDLPGIGRNMHRRLVGHGVQTVEQLSRLTREQLTAIWRSRVLGRQWYGQLHGEDVEPARTRRRSFSQSHVLGPEFRTHEAAGAVMMRLLHKAAFRMRRLGYYTRQVTFYMAYMRKPRWTYRQRLEPCCDTQTLLEVFARAWPDQSIGVPLQASVVLDDLLDKAAVPRWLFEPVNRRDNLAATMDLINDRFGAGTMCHGSLLGTEGSAPVRISFTQIPGLDEFDDQHANDPPS